ncbi:MAG: hypothetical protein U0Q15_20380 [Kineosporiaceae bacterium]
MAPLLTTRSPLFWLVVLAGVVLPALTLDGVTRAVVTSAVVVLVAGGLVRARRRRDAAAAGS